MNRPTCGFTSPSSRCLALAHGPTIVFAMSPPRSADAHHRLAASYRQVRRLTRRSGSNFYRSFWLLPADKRSAMCAIYAFARVTDDLADCDAPSEQRQLWLAGWRRATEIGLQNRQTLADDPQPFMAVSGDDHEGLIADRLLPAWYPTAEHVLPAVMDSVTRYQIPDRYLLEIIDGAIADQKKTRFASFEQLEHYCYLVASAVGLACLHIWGFRPPLPVQAAIDCGIAFQLTNILRDISEDARRGRIYLPQQHWDRHGLCEDDLLHPRPDDRLKCLIRDEARRASQLFDSGWAVWDSLHEDGRPMFSMMWRTYRRLLSHIEADPCSVFTRRVRLSQPEKWRLISQHFLPPWFSRLPVPPLESSLIHAPIHANR